MVKEDIDKLRELLTESDSADLVAFFNNLGINVDAEIIYDNFDIPMQEFTSMIENNEDMMSYLKSKPHQYIADYIYYFKREDISRELIDKRHQYGFTSDEIIFLAANIKDSEYIKKLVEEMLPELHADDAVSLIRMTKDSKFCKHFIEEYKLSDEVIIEIAQGIDDIGYIKKLVKDIKSQENKAKLVIGTKNINFMKSVIENYKEYDFSSKNAALRIGVGTKEEDYMKSLIDEVEVEFDIDAGTVISELALGINDPSFTKSLIEEHTNYFQTVVNRTNNSGSYRDYHFSPQNMSSLLLSLKEPEYIKKYLIEDKFIFKGTDFASLIAATEDPSFVKRKIKDMKYFGEIYEIDDEASTILLKATKDPEYISKYINSRKNKIVEEQEKNKITLPPNMTVGVEIESEMGINDWEGLIPEGWSAKRDASLVSGLEIVSPILNGDTHSADTIYDVCAGLEASHHLISANCGGHIHIGADYLTSVESYKNLMEIWSNAEKILYIISNAPGDLPRENVTYYAPPISKKIEDAIINGQVDLANENDLEMFVNSLQQIQGTTDTSRYSGINFKNTLKSTKNTIEFRLSNGTLDPDAWIENINLYGGIVKAAEELAQIQNKSPEELTTEEEDKLEILNFLKDDKMDEEDRLEALLELTISEEQRDLYRERYEENSRLLKYKYSRNEALNDLMANNPLKIAEVANAMLTGENQVLGQEYNQISTSITHDLNPDKTQEAEK